MTKIKKCLICGSDCRIFEWQCGDNPIPLYRVVCNENQHCFDAWFEKKEDAIEDWNERPQYDKDLQEFAEWCIINNWHFLPKHSIWFKITDKKYDKKTTSQLQEIWEVETGRRKK